MATIVAQEPMALSASATRNPTTRGERGEPVLSSPPMGRTLPSGLSPQSANCSPTSSSERAHSASALAGSTA
jgi:hypothetical protein